MRTEAKRDMWDDWADSGKKEMEWRENHPDLYAADRVTEAQRLLKERADWKRRCVAENITIQDFDYDIDDDWALHYLTLTVEAVGTEAVLAIPHSPYGDLNVRKIMADRAKTADWLTANNVYLTEDEREWAPNWSADRRAEFDFMRELIQRNNASEKAAQDLLYVDVAALLSGNMQRVVPTVGNRTDGQPFIYAGAVNVLFGNPEAGKTLVASAIAADTIFAGGSVLWADMDYNGATATIMRFRAFGVSTEVLSDRSRFRMTIPEDKAAMLATVKDAESWKPTISIVDSIGELLALFGANPNSDEDYAPVHRSVLAKLASTGSAVLAIDHEAKGQGSRDYGASGAVAKKRAIDGVMLRASVRRPFTPGKGGKSLLTILKDRHGGVREISPTSDKEPLAASFELIEDKATDWKFWAPDGAPTTKPSGVVSDLDLLRQLNPAPKSIYDVKLRMQWGAQRATEAFRMFTEAA